MRGSRSEPNCMSRFNASSAHTRKSHSSQIVQPNLLFISFNFRVVMCRTEVVSFIALPIQIIRSILHRWRLVECRNFFSDRPTSFNSIQRNIQCYESDISAWRNTRRLFTWQEINRCRYCSPFSQSRGLSSRHPTFHSPWGFYQTIFCVICPPGSSCKYSETITAATSIVRVTAPLPTFERQSSNQQQFQHQQHRNRFSWNVHESFVFLLPYPPTA